MLELEFYAGRPGLLRRGQVFRWRLTTANGQIVGASTEAYRTKSDCRLNAMTVTQYQERANVKVREAW